MRSTVDTERMKESGTEKGQQIMEEELRQSEKRLAAAVEHSGLQYWEYDIINDRAILSGKAQGDFRLGEVIENFPEAWFTTGYIHPEDVDKYRQMMLEVKNGRPYAEWETRALDLKNGAYRWMKIRYTTIFDEEGRAIRAVATAQDVNAYMELESRFIQTLVQNGIWAWDFDMQTRNIIKYKMLGQEDPFGYGEEVIPNVPESIVEHGTIYKDDVELYLDLYLRIYQGERKVSAKVRGWLEGRKEYVWQELIFTVIHDMDGKPIRALCTSRDISEEKQMEQRYLEENQYREEISSSMIATCQLNLTKHRLEEVVLRGYVVPLSEEMEKITDYKERTGYFIGQSEISDEDNLRLSPDELMKQYAKGKSLISAEYNAKNKEDAELIRVHVDCRVLKKPETGELTAFFYESDVTQEYCVGYIMDSIMNYEYDMVGLIFASSGTVYSHVRKKDSGLPAGKSSNYDQICETFLRKCACGENLDELVSAVKLGRVREILEKEPAYFIEFTMQEANGRIRRKEIRFSYINRREQLISVSRRDIEDIVQAEKQKQEQLEQALNLAERANGAKSEFLSRMSHEMRTPMNAIIGLLSLAEEEQADMTAVQDYLKKIGASSRHLLNLINDVLDMSKIESGEMMLHPVACRFYEFTEDVRGVIKPLCDQKKIRFVEEGEQVKTAVIGDKLRFGQVLLNLLSNAVKFTPEGGEIVFRYKSRTEKGMLLADFEISDNGIGISSEFQKRMFTPFTQEGRVNTGAVHGTGLGLSISKAIIDKMNGTIRVKSEPACGTCFMIHAEFPLAEKEQAQDGKRVQSEAEISTCLSGKCVLVAEDHPMNQMIAKRILQNNGLQVVTADNGKECVELFERSVPGYFDAVLMDIRMPVMDGIAAAVKIRGLKREDAKKIPIIAMTANAFDEDVRKTKEAGMNAHLAKPVETTVLLSTLAAWIGEEQTKTDIEGDRT